MASTGQEEASLVQLRPPQPAKGCSSVRVRRWTTRVTMAMFFLAGGIEYSVIIPTLWDYLRSKGGEEWLYGLTLAAFSISNLFAGPLYGVVFDATHQTKLIVLFANLFEIGGKLTLVPRSALLIPGHVPVIVRMSRDMGTFVPGHYLDTVRLCTIHCLIVQEISCTFQPLPNT